MRNPYADFVLPNSSWLKPTASCTTELPKVAMAIMVTIACTMAGRRRTYRSPSRNSSRNRRRPAAITCPRGWIIVNATNTRRNDSRVADERPPGP